MFTVFHFGGAVSEGNALVCVASLTLQLLAYSGGGFFMNCPRTWVPLQPVEVYSSVRRQLSRVQFPLRLCYAMTVHKSQSLTAPEGTVLNFKAKRNITAVPGLAYVGATRATSWSRQAFRSVPSLADFLSVRLTTDFKKREVFEAWADGAHLATMVNMGVSEASEVAAHVTHLNEQYMKQLGRRAREEEIQDLKNMLSARGVASVPEETLTALQAAASLKAEKPTLAQLVQHMRGSGRGSALKTEGFGRQAENQKRQKPSVKPVSTENLTLDMLRCMGIDDVKAAEAVSRYPYSVEHAVSWVFEEVNEADTKQLSQGASVLEALVNMGFQQDAATKVAEEGLPLQQAVEQLLQGHRNPTDTESLRRRREKKSHKKFQVETVLLSPLPPRDEQQYIMRAVAELGGLWEVVDLGSVAGTRRNACMWLAVVAAVSRCRRVDDGILGAWMVANEAGFQAVEQTSVELLKWKAGRGGRPGARDAVGKLADELRQTFCSEGGLMATQPLAATYWPFYAALQGPASSFESYTGAFTECLVVLRFFEY